jgi:hypothetical protein
MLEHIGDMTVSFTMLESFVQMLVGSLILEHQRIGQIITAELPFRGLRALVISLYKERHGEDDDFLRLQELTKRAGEIEEKRNQITHSVWAAGQHPGTVTRVKTTVKEKQGVRFHFENVREMDLAKVADDIKQLAGDFMQFQS